MKEDKGVSVLDTPRRSPSDARTTQNKQRVRKSTVKVQKSNAEPFRAVLCEVIRKEVSLCRKSTTDET